MASESAAGAAAPGNVSSSSILVPKSSADGTGADAAAPAATFTAVSLYAISQQMQLKETNRPPTT